MADLTISIINYKTRELTEKCIKSIVERNWQTKFELIMVDNASEDGSVEYLKNRFSRMKIIESKKNLGFAGGHNLSFKQTSSKYFLIVNSDVQVLDNSIDQVVNLMSEHKNVAVAGPKVLNFDNSLQPNGGDLPFGLALINWLFNLEMFGFRTTFHRADLEYYQLPHEVGWVSGNFMIVRTEVAKKIGFLNEDYFMYFEDAEFCFRIKKAGFKVMIDPTVSIKHLSGGSLDNPRLRQWTGEYKGLIIFYKNQFGLLGEVVIRLLIYLSSILRIIAFAAVGKLQFSKTYAQVITSI